MILGVSQCRKKTIVNESGYAVILTDEGADLIRKIDNASLREANDLHYVLSSGFSVLDGLFAQLQLHQPDAPWLQIQIPIAYVMGTVYLGGNKQVAGFSAN